MNVEYPEIIGNSQEIKKVIDLTQKLSNISLNVLLTGESGVGKELIARSLHSNSKLKAEPFVKVNSAALPSELLESELFGYEKGAFTGADRPKVGKFELAGKGCIFLDEIGEIPLSMQAKLLQVLQDKKFYRLGGQTEIQSRARVIAATNQNLDNEISNGNFREDLFYRLSTVTIHIPPLRERKEDLQPLIEHILYKLNKENEVPALNIPSSLMTLFYRYHWPGNVRELENYLNSLSVLRNYQELENQIKKQLESPYRGPQQETKDKEAEEEDENKIKVSLDCNTFSSLKEVRDHAVRKVEKEAIKKVLDATSWNRKKAASILKISYRALLYKIKEMDIKPS